MLNQCSFIGNLGADPEIRSFANGGRVANLRLAVSEKWKDKNTGEQKEHTEWVSVAIMQDGLVGVAERFLRKGSKIYVQGKWKTRKWQDQGGNDRYSTECVLQGFGGQLVMLDGAQGGGQPSGGTGGATPPPQDGGYDDIDDEIPFVTSDGIF